MKRRTTVVTTASIENGKECWWSLVGLLEWLAEAEKRYNRTNLLVVDSIYLLVFERNGHHPWTKFFKRTRDYVCAKFVSRFGKEHARQLCFLIQNKFQLGTEHVGKDALEEIVGWASLLAGCFVFHEDISEPGLGYRVLVGTDDELVVGVTGANIAALCPTYAGGRLIVLDNRPDEARSLEKAPSLSH